MAVGDGGRAGEVTAVQMDDQFVVDRTDLMGNYDLWRLDPVRQIYTLVGGITYSSLDRVFGVWGMQTDREDAEGNPLLDMPYLTEDFADAYATLWSRRYTL